MNYENPYQLHRAISAGDFRHLALQRAFDMIRTLRLKLDSRPGQFQGRMSTTVIRFITLEELYKAVQDELKLLKKQANDVQAKKSELVDATPWVDHVGFEKAIKPCLDQIANRGDRSRGGLLLLDAFNTLLEIEDRFCETVADRPTNICRTLADENNIYIYIEDSKFDAVSFNDRVEDTRFVASVGAMLRQSRSMKEAAPAKEAAAVQAAYEILARGVAVASPYRSLGVPGFKEVQTLLHLTDPGEGHLRVTCASKKILEDGGTVVHIEHIDREEHKDPKVVEPYRLPAPINAAKVRLHVGSEAPCTAYIGRPIFENRGKQESYFQLDLLKTAHITAGACTSMFLNGIAECKIGIEGMTSSQGVQFMRAIAGNVFRDRRRQYLSAAFNIFTQVSDDRNDDKGGRAIGGTSQDQVKELCELGLEMARAGQFDKVTWDGAGMEFPSEPILARAKPPILSHRYWVELIHRAHTNGLMTYVSAGLEPQHMPRAVYCGLDGIGIGVKLHYYDPVGRRLGELKADEMLSVLSTAERASKTILGEAAKVLARLGRIEFELNSEAGLQLPDAIAKARDDLKNILGAYEPPEAIPVDDPAILEKLGTQERREAMKVREEKIEVVTEQLIQDGDTSLQAQKIEKLLAKWPLVMIKEMKIDKPMTDPLVGLLKRLKEDYPNLLRPSSEPPMRKDLAADVLGGRGGKTKSKPATGFSPIRSPLTQQIDPFATARQRLMGELSREDLMLLLADS